MSDPPPAPAPPATKPVRRSASTPWKDALKVWGPLVLVAAALFAVAWLFVEPAPPSIVRLATGVPGGAYERIGARYAERFTDNGITLAQVETAGSVENVAELVAGRVDAALVQAGTVPEKDRELIEAVVAVTYEPLLVFVRDDAVAGAGMAESLDVLAGRIVAVGAEGSGTRLLVETLIAELGFDAQIETTQTELRALGGTEAADALIAGDVDAACFVMDPDAAIVSRLLAASGVSLLDLRRSPAWSHRLPYLAAVTLDEGVVDPTANLPPRDVRTVAPVAYFAVRPDTHRAVVQLLVGAAKDDAGARSLVAAPGAFPSLERMDAPVADEARYFFERGPNVLHRLFPFWLASLIDRLIILVIPLLAILIPLFKAAPPMLRWSVRRRIYRWYRQLRVIDDELSHGDLPRARLEADLDQLRALDTEVAETDVPLSYMEEFYNLRLHIAYMRQRTEHRLQVSRRGSSTEDNTGPQVT